MATRGARARNELCSEGFGVSFGALCSLVAIAARAAAGLETSFCDVEHLLHEEGLCHNGYFLELAKLYLIREVRRVGNRRFYLPTLVGAAKVAQATRQAA